MKTFILSVFVVGLMDCTSAGILCGADVDVANSQNPLSLDESLRSIQVRDGFELELVAAEPIIADPVAIDWDPQGRLWVVEMADYPMGMDGQGKPGGRVRILEDKNNDGRFESSTLFLDGLHFPTGIITWREGAIITAAPEIIYAQDTDGDHRADTRRTLYSGFHQGNQQLRVNGLRWGLDNWIYCASGSHHAGYGANTGIDCRLINERIIVGSRDFRIRPDLGLLEPQSGPSQFGRNRDDWGNWFGVQNSYPLWHYVLAENYVARNPFFAPKGVRKMLTESNPRLYPIKTPQKRFHSFEHSIRFTSACSGMVYRDELLFDRSLQHSFSCAPFHSLVQHNVLRENGVSFELTRDAEEVEQDFFASKDRWCRPVMARTGPDGALWIVDMCRYMIEHPQWVNDAAKAELRPFYRHGEKLGRIYRVFPKGKRRPVPKMNSLSTIELVRSLSHENGWVRDKAQQMLIWQADKSCIALLQNESRESTSALARLHAICTLDGLKSLGEATLVARLADEHPAVRRHAVRLAENRQSPSQHLHRSVERLATDSNAKVRLQVAYALGELYSSENGTTIGKMIANEKDDFIISAAMSSVSKQNLRDVVDEVLQNGVDLRVLKSLMRSAAHYEDRSTLKLTADSILRNDRPPEHQFQLLATLLDVVPTEKLTSVIGEANSQLDATIQSANELAGSPKAAESLRVAAIQLVARQERLDGETIERIERILAAGNSPRIQHAVIERLGQRSDLQIGEIFIAHWSFVGPSTRAHLAATLLSRKVWTNQLIGALEAKRISTGDIEASVRQRLVRQQDKKLSDRAKTLFASTMSQDRSLIVDKYRHALKLNSDTSAGKAVFKKNCSNCHRIDGMGNEVGPNLKAITDKSEAAFLTSIFDPSRAIESKYISYTIQTTDGRVYSGIISSETGSSIELTASDGKRITILRTEIDAMQSSGKSLMPDGLEKQMSPQDFTNLIAYLMKALRN